MGYTQCFLMCLIYGCLIQQRRCNDYRKQLNKAYSAHINITYEDPVTGKTKSEIEESGYFSSASRIDAEQGWVVLVRTADNQLHGCTPPVNVPSGRWIALVERGSCTFHKKITNAAVNRNASAVVIYNQKDENEVISMDHKVEDVVSIFLPKKHGLRIKDLLNNDTRVWMQITVGKELDGLYGPTQAINKTSVLFVSISFIVLMIISLAWLVFYYIQRFRYAHAKERLSKRLMHAARKAITRMPMRTLKNGDKETDQEYDPCAVCIDNYRSGDVVRILPCKHIFHKSCVDPWLIDQRTCPMCKLDILKAFGLQIHPSRESLINMDLDGMSTSIGPSELLPSNSAFRDDHHIVELVYYPYNVHLRPRLPETRSEAEETITGLEPAIASPDNMEYDYNKCVESEALIPRSVKGNEGEGVIEHCSNNQITVTCVIENSNDDSCSKKTKRSPDFNTDNDTKAAINDNNINESKCCETGEVGAAVTATVDRNESSDTSHKDINETSEDNKDDVGGGVGGKLSSCGDNNTSRSNDKHGEDLEEDDVSNVEVPPELQVLLDRSSSSNQGNSTTPVAAVHEGHAGDRCGEMNTTGTSQV